MDFQNHIIVVRYKGLGGGLNSYLPNLSTTKSRCWLTPKKIWFYSFYLANLYVKKARNRSDFQNSPKFLCALLLIYRLSFWLRWLVKVAKGPHQFLLQEFQFLSVETQTDVLPPYPHLTKMQSFALLVNQVHVEASVGRKKVLQIFKFSCIICVIPK